MPDSSTSKDQEPGEMSDGEIVDDGTTADPATDSLAKADPFGTSRGRTRSKHGPSSPPPPDFQIVPSSRSRGHTHHNHQRRTSPPPAFELITRPSRPGGPGAGHNVRDFGSDRRQHGGGGGSLRRHPPPLEFGSVAAHSSTRPPPRHRRGSLHGIGYPGPPAPMPLPPPTPPTAAAASSTLVSPVHDRFREASLECPPAIPKSATDSEFSIGSAETRERSVPPPPLPSAPPRRGSSSVSLALPPPPPGPPPMHAADRPRGQIPTFQQDPLHRALAVVGIGAGEVPEAAQRIRGLPNGTCLIIQGTEPWISVAATATAIGTGTVSGVTVTASGDLRTAIGMHRLFSVLVQVIWTHAWVRIPGTGTEVAGAEILTNRVVPGVAYHHRHQRRKPTGSITAATATGTFETLTAVSTHTFQAASRHHVMAIVECRRHHRTGDRLLLTTMPCPHCPPGALGRIRLRMSTCRRHCRLLRNSKHTVVAYAGGHGRDRDPDRAHRIRHRCRRTPSAP
ncbi:hypothetical protein BCR44DRAFT_1016608 [Catenaria anguillulae PL171]|uniref:Uncharacterized protein n=1 Tax=Catenaria anguillulae PL171 TaxID=765915 RepID=A0A1Y2HWH4_9FUNG|nr:hypothetical protein BCR44DRAFT_1016608 [Catenaria anguillulae PL171]